MKAIQKNIYPFFIFIMCCLYLPINLFAWELAKDEDGIKVYTREVKGAEIKEYKAVMNLKTSLSSLVALLKDVPAYKAWIYTTEKSEALKKINPRESIIYSMNNTPWPISDRDTVFYNSINQDPKRLIVTIKITGKNDYIPEKSNLVRIKTMNGSWRFIPKDNGIVEVNYQMHNDPGGNIPSWFINLVVVKQPFETLMKIKKIIMQDKYQNAKYNFIKEK